MGMNVGDAQVSTFGRNLGLQLDRLADYDLIYLEKLSAPSAKNRPELINALDFVREEAVIVVIKLDHPG